MDMLYFVLFVFKTGNIVQIYNKEIIYAYYELLIYVLFITNMLETLKFKNSVPGLIEFQLVFFDKNASVNYLGNFAWPGRKFKDKSQ